MKLGLSLELTIPPSVEPADLRLLGRLYAPSGTVQTGEEPLALEDAVENIFADPTGVAVPLLAELGVTWNAIRTGEVVPDVAPVNDSRQRLDNQPG